MVLVAHRCVGADWIGAIRRSLEISYHEANPTTKPLRTSYGSAHIDENMREDNKLCLCTTVQLL